MIAQTTTVELARAIRANALKMVHDAKASHIGSCLSIADILAVLYGDVMKVRPAHPDWEYRDRFILSKGHAAAILYATLAERGFFPKEWLNSYGQSGSPLLGHTNHVVPGIEFSTGSLGHGLPFGCGLALVAKREQLPWRTYVLLSDGELDEGSNWEAALFAGHHELSSLVAIVDHNKIQSFGRVEDVMRLDPLADKFRAFRWNVLEVDGHDHAALTQALQAPMIERRPTMIIAHTTKGKGVLEMENDNRWHYASPSDAQLTKALVEL